MPRVDELGTRRWRRPTTPTSGYDKDAVIPKFNLIVYIYKRWFCDVINAVRAPTSAQTLTDNGYRSVIGRRVVQNCPGACLANQLVPISPHTTHDTTFSICNFFHQPLSHTKSIQDAHGYPLVQTRQHGQRLISIWMTNIPKDVHHPTSHQSPGSRTQSGSKIGNGARTWKQNPRSPHKPTHAHIVTAKHGQHGDTVSSHVEVGTCHIVVWIIL